METSLNALKELKTFINSNYKVSLDTREAILDAYKGKSQISIQLKLKKLTYLSDSAYDNFHQTVIDILHYHQ